MHENPLENARDISQTMPPRASMWGHFGNGWGPPQAGALCMFFSPRNANRMSKESKKFPHLPGGGDFPNHACIARR